MWNLGETGARFRAAAPNHPEALLEEPQAFQAVGEKSVSSILRAPDTLASQGLFELLHLLLVPGPRGWRIHLEDYDRIVKHRL